MRLAPRFGFVFFFLLVSVWVLNGRPVLSTAPLDFLGPPELLELEYVGIMLLRGGRVQPLTAAEAVGAGRKGGRIATCGPDCKGARRLGT